MHETAEHIPTPPQPPKAGEVFHERRQWVWIRRFARLLVRAFALFVALFILLAFVIQLPSVQVWGIQKTTNFLSKELNTEVRIGDFRLDFFDEISIGNIYLGNQNAPNDTLISVGRLRVDINYFDLAWGILQLDAVRLERAKVRIRRDEGKYFDNIQFLVDYFDPPKPRKTNTAPKQPDIRFAQIHLRDIDFQQDNRVRGQVVAVRLKAADIHTNIMNLPNQIMDLTRVNVFDPDVHIIETPSKPMPPMPDSIKIKRGIPISIAQAPEKQSEKSPAKKAFQFLIGAISVENGVFKLDKWDVAPSVLPDSILDFDHLKVHDAHIAIHNFMFTKDEWTGVVDGISCKTSSGFELKKLTVGDAKITPTETALYGLQIETPNSLMGDTFRMMYPKGYMSFVNSFNNEVTMDARIHTSKVMIGDIMTFAPDLYENPFFRKNRYANARIETQIFGKVNSLKAKPFNIQLGEGLVAEGTFESRDLTRRDETFINLNLKSLRTNMTALRQLIPNLNLAKDFDKLDGLNFTGEFVGFFNAFSTKGRLESAIGAAAFDMSLKPESDSAQANYSGSLALDRFNLAAFTGNSDLGKISLKTEILRGRGFTKNTLNMDLVAVVDNFQFKNYDYHNLNLNGSVNSKRFVGNFESRDPNVDFLFNGTIDFETDKPAYKFTSDIRRLDFQKLNLLKEDLALVGTFNLDLAGRKLSELTGTVDARNLLIIKDKTERYTLDSLFVKSDITAPLGMPHLAVKDFDLRSEVLHAHVHGQFNLEDIPAAFKKQFAKFHPRLAEDLNLSPKNTATDALSSQGSPFRKESFGLDLIVNQTPHNFDFIVHVLNSKNLTALIDPKLDTLRNIKIEGVFDDSRDAYSWSIVTPETHRYGNINIVEFGSIGRAEREDIDWDLNITALKINELDFRTILFQNHVTGDTVEFGFTSPDFSTALDIKDLELNALLMRQDSAYKLSFGTSALSRLKVYGDEWSIDKDNYILFSKDKLEIEDFEIRHDDREITLRSVGRRGLHAFLDNFDIRFLNHIIDDDRFTMQGKYQLWAGIGDIFTGQNFGMTALLDSFIVKGEHRGMLVVEASGDNFNAPIKLDLSLSKDSSRLGIAGFFHPSVSALQKRDSLDFQVHLKSFPFKTLQLLIEEGASDFKGRIDGTVKVEGPLKAINTNGSLRIRDGEVTIDYLKIPVKVKDETVRITNNSFDATGSKIHDKFDNAATITGGLTHNRFEDFGLNVRVVSKNFLCLNTTRDDNPLYYGTGIGAGDISFTGDFNRTDIKIISKTGKGTKITFPFSTEQTASDKGFVVFKNRNKPDTTTVEKPKFRDLRGVKLDMQLSITPDAETNLIFDEVAGDNIKAFGRGDFQINIGRAGELTMDGIYTIERGDYQFTLMRVVNKNFVIQPGGTIQWNGSPFDATLNINAGYNRITTSPYNFISELVESDQSVKNESFKPTPVELTLKLSGAMLKPDINFDLAFPQLQGALKSYTDNQLRIVKADVNDLNKQVFGLIVIGGFLPTDIGVSEIRSGGINTLTETASNVLSNMLNKLVGEYVSGLDIQIGYNLYQFDATGNTPQQLGSGQQFRLRGSYAIDDRFTISGGVGVEQGDYVQALSQSQSNVFVGGDVIIDYAFSDDRRLKLRVSYTRDQTFEGRRDKPAAGIRFRQEFDSLDELLKSLNLKKVKEEKPEILN